MTSNTTIKRRLRPTHQNIDEAEDKQCRCTPPRGLQLDTNMLIVV